MKSLFDAPKIRVKDQIKMETEKCAVKYKTGVVKYIVKVEVNYIYRDSLMMITSLKGTCGNKLLNHSE